MSTVIISHGYKTATNNIRGCNDGDVAAWIALKAYPDAQHIRCYYPTIDKATNSIKEIVVPNIEPNSRVIVVDFSFPKYVLDTWIKNHCEVTVLDHHITAARFLEGFSGGILKFDVAECGATLTHQFFFPDKPIPAFVNYIKDRDLWQWKLPYSKEINAAIAWYKQQYEELDLDSLKVFDQFETLTDQQLIEQLQPLGTDVLKAQQDDITEIVKRCVWKEVQGYTIPTIKLLSEEEAVLTSDICERLYHTYPEANFVATYQEVEATNNKGETENKIVWSFRSNAKGNNFDVESIALSLGGGGHRNASGATVIN